MSSAVFSAELLTVGQWALELDGCKVNLARDSVRFFLRDEDGLFFASLSKVESQLNRSGQRLFCASNAGIYGKDLRPIGLYVENGHIYRRLNIRKEGYGNFYLQPNGVFWLSDRSAAIVTTEEMQARWDQVQSQIRFATQSGPILLQNGKVNALFQPESDNRLVRNAACIKSSSEFILVKSRYPINFYDFAVGMLHGFGCTDALYLDGSVSELYPYATRLLNVDFGPMIGVIQSSSSH